MRNILENLSPSLRSIACNIEQFSSLQEMRIRIGRPLMVCDNEGSKFVSCDGKLLRHPQNTYIVTKEDIASCLELMSESSIYAFIEEIKKGFITIKGGNRVGLCGRLVLKDEQVINIHDINGLNIRMAKQIIGAADGIMDRIYDKTDKTVQNVLIISPPACGKTTILRDAARQLGQIMKVSIVDERGEIAACYKGRPQFDVGMQTDVADLCPKSVGMLMMIRSMSPDVIITDEITTPKDLEIISKVINLGVKIITSAHGFDIDDVNRRLPIGENRFDRIIILSRRRGAGTVEQVWNAPN